MKFNAARCCPHCQRPFPPPICVPGTLMQRTLQFIGDNPQGVSRPQVMDHIYGNDIDGGPENPVVVSVMVNRLNKRLKKHHLRIHSSKGHQATYRLVDSQ